MQRTLLLLAAGTLMGCSTDLDVNAPYKDISVVYGLLNMRDSVHYVKLNKAFLGEGDATIYAQIPDSSEYRPEDITFAKIFRYNENGQLADSFPLIDTLIENREPGVFYSPYQRVQYFRTPEPVILNGSPQISTGPTYLHQNSSYKLVVDVKGKRITSETTIVNDFTLPGSSVLNLPTLNLVASNGDYVNLELKFNSSRDGKRYVVAYRFNFLEVRGTDTLAKVVERPIGTTVSPNSQTINQLLSVTLPGDLFFSNLANAVPDDPAVDKRIFTGIDILFTLANDEFHTYLTLSEPVSGIVEERPAYSNVENAYGLFASRYTRTLANKRFNDATLNELINGQYTGTRRFCSGYSVGPPYGCN